MSAKILEILQTSQRTFANIPREILQCEGVAERQAQRVPPPGELRAVKLGKADFPFLDERIFFREQGDGPGDSLRARLQTQELDVIRDASVTLFATFAGLLTTVIGGRLAWSLLGDVWPERFRSETEFQEADE